MILTKDEIEQITGYKRSADQIKWLDSRGWAHEVSAAGRPIVSRAYAENRLGVVATNHEPDFSFLAKAA